MNRSVNPGTGWQRSLRRLGSTLGQYPVPQKIRAERCELCSLELARRHQHLILPEKRELVCVCDPCALLFDADGKTQYRRIPRDARRLSDFILPDEAWARLLVPISLAFVYPTSEPRRVSACYPSPAGITEAEVEPEAWAPIVAANPVLRELHEDTEALLVNRLKKRREYFIAPIDQCFELVGLVRTCWRGFSGGDRVWEEVDRFLSNLRESARP